MRHCFLPDQSQKLIDVIDLKNKTLVPGFVDGHSHLFQVSYLPTFANLLPDPDGPKPPITSITDIVDALKAHVKELEKEYQKENKGKPLPGNTVIVGNGYDESRLTDKRPPTKEDLNAEPLNKYPVIVFHQSGHFSVSNDKALTKSRIKDRIKQMPPIDKVYYKIDKNGKPTDEMSGLMGEDAHIYVLRNVGIPLLTEEMLKKGENLYIEQGFTTVQDGRLSPEGWRIIACEEDYCRSIFKDNPNFRFRVDVVFYIDAEMVGTRPVDWHYDSYMSNDRCSSNRGLRIAGHKFGLDGSPQGKSAWLTEEYKNPLDESLPCGEGNYAPLEKSLRCGERDIEIPDNPGKPNAKRLKDLMVRAYERGWQVLVHANGDAAIDQLIKVEGEIQKDPASKKYAQDRRTVLIHGQFLRKDQIADLKALNIFPSLFPMHTFYWGDWYKSDVVGDKDGRAEFISPIRAVQDQGMRFSIHSDAPVTFPDSMRLLDSAVNRTTRSGIVLGKDQQIRPIVALKALTLWPAYQHFEETNNICKNIPGKGSIEVGKLADFVILSHNPMTIPEKDLKNLICIQIVDTIKAGKSIHPHPLKNVEGDQSFAPDCATNRVRH